MALKTLTTTKLVQAYLHATGDTLSATACRALGLPFGRHFLHDLRQRLALLDCPGGVRLGNDCANHGKGSRLSAAAALRLVIDQLSEDTFCTADIRERIQLRSATQSKALRSLEQEGFIERVPSPRPYRYRRLSQPRPDFIMVFMAAHGLYPTTPTRISLGHLPLLANRALCGLSIAGLYLAEAATDLTARYAGVTLSAPPLPALTPLLLAVMNGGGDARSALRGLRTALQEALAVRRCWDRIAPEEVTGSPLTAFCLTEEWMALLSTQGGLGAFIEAATQALGGELYPAKAHNLAEMAVREATKAMKTSGITVTYDAEGKRLNGLNESDLVPVEGALRAKLAELARKVSLPVRLVSVNELYRRAAMEIGYPSTLLKTKKLQ